MAKPILKWRKRKGEWRAGPFRITTHRYLMCDGGYCNHAWPFASVAAAKAQAAVLVRRIIAATKGKRHGK